MKIKMPNEWRTIKSLLHKIRLHDRRGKGTAESFSREKSSHAHRRRKVDEKSCATFLLCDPRLVRPTNLMSRRNGKKKHTHTLLSIADIFLHYLCEDSFFLKFIFTYYSDTPIYYLYILFVTQLPSWRDGLHFLFGVFLP